MYLYILVNYLIVVTTDVLECVEMTKQFRDFLVIKLQMAYTKVVKKTNTHF